MAKLVGIDIRAHQIRAVLLRTSYRRVAVEAMAEVDRATVESLEAAIRAAAGSLVQHSESVAVALDGQSCFIHRISLPATAAKQIAEIVPFELEAQVPLDLDELVYDFRTLPRTPDNQIPVLAAAARQSEVSRTIAALDTALDHQAERVAVGGLPLANLASLSAVLSVPTPIAIVDLGDTASDIVVLVGGHAAYCRTLSIGVAGLPETADRLLSGIRQTLAAWGTFGDPIESVYLTGAGADVPGAEAYLSGELGVAVQRLPGLRFENLSHDYAEMVPRFAKAIGLALGVGTSARDLDLRQGSLSFQRSYEFVKERVPLLAGLSAAVFVSFLFSTCAQSSALDNDNDVLSGALGKLSQDALGVETSDPDEVMDLLDKGLAREIDPQPEVDGFDIVVEIAKAVPDTITHDIDEFDFQRNHVKLRGLVSSTEEAQTIAENLKRHNCFKGVNIGKITQVVNKDRQRYELEFDVKCGEEKKAKEEKSEEGEGE